MSETGGKTTLNIDVSVARAMCYIPWLGVLVSVVFLILEKHSKVRWDAIQAILLWLIVSTLGWMLQTAFMGFRLVGLVNLIGMIVIPLVLAIKASKNEDTKIPVLAELVNTLADKIHGEGKK